MGINFDLIALQSIYSVLGVNAVITTAAGDHHTVRAIDKTSGVEVGDGVTVLSIAPACDLRAVQLAEKNVSRIDLDQGSIELNGITWRITATAPRPGINGEADGEVRLILATTE